MNNNKNIQQKIETTEQILRQAKNKYYLKREHLNPHQPSSSHSSLSSKRQDAQFQQNQQKKQQHDDANVNAMQGHSSP